MDIIDVLIVYDMHFHFKSELIPFQVITVSEIGENLRKSKKALTGEFF